MRKYLLYLLIDNCNEIKSIKKFIKKSNSISILQIYIYYFNNEQIKNKNSLIVQKGNHTFKINNNYEIRRRIFLRQILKIFPICIASGHLRQ